MGFFGAQTLAKAQGESGSNDLYHRLGCKGCGKFERWKPIPGWSLYEVSSIGRVRKKKHQGRQRLVLSSLVSVRKDSDGYLTVTLFRWENDKYKIVGYRVARLILAAFRRLPKKGEVSRHLDDDNAFNCLCNLAWGTNKQNAQDAVRNCRRPVGSEIKVAKLTESKVAEARLLFNHDQKKYSKAILARKYKVSRAAIHYALTRKTWRGVK